MTCIYDKLDSIKKNLDSLELFNSLDQSFLNIEKNSELMTKIKKYNEKPNQDLKFDIYNYEEIRKYKSLENEVNFLILHINQKIKSINSIRSCKNENN